MAKANSRMSKKEAAKALGKLKLAIRERLAEEAKAGRPTIMVYDPDLDAFKCQRMASANNPHAKIVYLLINNIMWACDCWSYYIGYENDEKLVGSVKLDDLNKVNDIVLLAIQELDKI
jgi:hypothetical protein